VICRTSRDEEIAVEIERPAEDVWAFVSNAENLPQWLEEFEAVVKESDGPIAGDRLSLHPCAGTQIGNDRGGRLAAWASVRLKRATASIARWWRTTTWIRRGDFHRRGSTTLPEPLSA
jgi:uncharacterized membrane protein